MIRLRAALFTLVALAVTFAQPTPLAARGKLGRQGHSARLLIDGSRSFAERERNIAAADVVLYKTYIFENDRTGHDTVRLLSQKARAGAKVFVQYDVKGTIDTPWKLLKLAFGFGNPIPKHLRPLVSAGVTLIPTNVPTLRDPLLGRDHDKLLVTWKRGEAARVIMGGMNVGDEYARPGAGPGAVPNNAGMRDTDVEFTGPMTKNVVDHFVGAARKQKSPMLRTLLDAVAPIHAESAAFDGDGLAGARVKFVYNSPSKGNNKHVIEKTYQHLLERTPAGQTVTISNAYFLPTRALRDAMQRAADRGVRFRILLNSPDAAEKEARTVARASMDLVGRMMRRAPAGAFEVFEWRGNAARSQGTIHQKVAAFGTSGPVVIGSANLDTLSARFNSETAAIVDDVRVRQQFDAMMARDLREGNTRLLSIEELRKRPLMKRLSHFAVRVLLGKYL